MLEIILNGSSLSLPQNPENRLFLSKRLPTREQKRNKYIFLLYERHEDRFIFWGFIGF